MCRKMRSWTHKTLSLRILFLQQNRYHSSSQHICDHLPMPNWKLSPKGGSGCLLLCQSPLSQAGNSWRMMCSGSPSQSPFTLLAVPSASWDEEHAGPSLNLLSPTVAWKSSCMHCSIFVLPCCCSVVFQAVLCSRCSQSHMCFFAPSNDIFPMKTVASTAFAVFVKNTNPTLWFSFQPSQK